MNSVLGDKLRAVKRVGRACLVARAHRELAYAAMLRGHMKHDRHEPHQDASVANWRNIDIETEIRAELADVLGYAALGLLRERRLTWRTRLYVALVGLAWRALGRGGA